MNYSLITDPLTNLECNLFMFSMHNRMSIKHFSSIAVGKLQFK